MTFSKVAMSSALQTIKMYELVTRHFNDREDARFLVEGIEDVIAVKFDEELERLATKEDLKQLEIRMEQGFNTQLKWMIGTMFAIAALTISLVKLL